MNAHSVLFSSPVCLLQNYCVFHVFVLSVGFVQGAVLGCVIITVINVTESL